MVIRHLYIWRYSRLNECPESLDHYITHPDARTGFTEKLELLRSKGDPGTTGIAQKRMLGMARREALRYQGRMRQRRHQTRARLLDEYFDNHPEVAFIRERGVAGVPEELGAGNLRIEDFWALVRFENELNFLR
ncbi:hypothetical protein [Pseudomonas viridiflava]|uniref:hypothetical protein n=1 Tax=Pseudomonas viridiflava TaxID=33069 RepID=UPI0020BE89D8|nr:hypothetical protein [Pseudomonas viridiflava]